MFDEDFFKWIVIAALQHEEIVNRKDCRSKLQRYKDQCKFQRREIPQTIQKIIKSEKSYIRKKDIYTPLRQNFNGTCNKASQLINDNG